MCAIQHINTSSFQVACLYSCCVDYTKKSTQINYYICFRSVPCLLLLPQTWQVLNSDGTSTNEKRSRKEVHQHGLWHRVVHVWLINPRGELLIQRVRRPLCLFLLVFRLHTCAPYTHTLHRYYACTHSTHLRMHTARMGIKTLPEVSFFSPVFYFDAES